MKIGYLVFNLDGMGGTSRSAITQANALAADHDITMLSVTRSADAPHYAIDSRITVVHLVDVRDDDHPAYADVAPTTAKALHARESALVPARWDKQFTALCDVALESTLPSLDVDVLVTVTPGLLATAIELTPDQVVVVHQEHRSSNDRTSGLEPLLAYAPRADVVALLTPVIEEWLRDQLGELAPTTVVLPNPLPLGFTPRSTLTDPLIMTAGRLVPEKQFPKLVDAFGQIADQVPEWRLRICGEGPQRLELVRQIRKWDLWDRVELPGSLPDMAAEWPKASIAALTSRAEGFPLVVQEAMAAGVPVASFDCPSGPREIIEHETNGLLVGPQSVTGMAAALLRLTTDDDLRHRLGRGALHTARQYDAHALAERWVKVFGDARARRAGRGRLAARAHTELRRPAADPTA
ncbi:MAG: glycosyltransferase family 4 protein, partial [Nocardioides sp.]